MTGRTGARGALAAGVAAALMATAATGAGAATFTSTQKVTLPFVAAFCAPLGVVPSDPYGTAVNADLPTTARVRAARVTLNGVRTDSLNALSVLLVAPSGARALLMRDAGGIILWGAPPWDTVDSLSLAFDHHAENQLPAAGTVSGTYRPTVGPLPCAEPMPAPAPSSVPYPSSLAGLNGEHAAGQWRLYVAATGVMLGITNEIAGWSLHLDHTTPATCVTPAPLSAPHGATVVARLVCKDADGDPLTLAIEEPPAHGTLGPIDQAGGTVVYTPIPGHTGPDSFTFSATDTDGRSNVARIRLDFAAAPPAAPATPPASTPPAAPVMRTIAPAAVTPLPGGRARIVQRVRFTRAGRHVLTLQGPGGKRLRWLAGSRVGGRALTRPAASVTVTIARPNRPVTITARVALAPRAVRAGRLKLRAKVTPKARPLTGAVVLAPARRR